jgi:hypothetical protein
MNSILCITPMNSHGLSFQARAAPGFVLLANESGRMV